MRSRIAIWFVLVLLAAPAEASPSALDPNEFEKLVQVIRTGNTYQREHAIQSLSKIDDSRVVPTLMELVEDPEAKIRVCAVQQLSVLADPRSADVLAGALDDSNPTVRSCAAVALAKIGSPRHIPALVASAVNDLPEPGTNEHEVLYSTSALDAIAKLSSKAPPEIMALLDRVSDERIVDRRNWWQLLQRTATCLGQIGDPAALDSLQRALKVLEQHHQDYQTWYAIRKAMAAIDPVNHPFDCPAADILVVHRQGKGQGYTTAPALLALGPDIVPDLAWVLRFDSQWDSELYAHLALDVLKKIGGDSVVTVLREYIQRQLKLSRSERSGYSISLALTNLLELEPKVETLDEVLTIAESFDGRALNDLVSTISQARSPQLPTEIRVAFYHAILHHPDWSGPFYASAGSRAVRSLGEIGGPEAGEILREVLLTPSNPHRDAAASALVRIKNYDAVPVLMEAAGQPVCSVTTLAAALGKIADLRAIPVLREMTQRIGLSGDDRLWIAAALARMGDEYDKNAALVREKLPRSMPQSVWLKDPETVTVLAELIRNNDDTDMRFVRIPDGINTLVSSYWRGQASTMAIEVLRVIGTPEAMDAVVSLMDTETDAWRLLRLSRLAAELGKKYNHPKIEEYERIAQVVSAAMKWFSISLQQQNITPPPSSQNYPILQKYPELARRVWIMEVTRQLDEAQRMQALPWLGIFKKETLHGIEPIFDPELVPVLERILRENTQTERCRGPVGFVEHYYIRSLAAAILTAKTGREYTFVDVDGQTHPGGWRPSMEP